MGMMPLRASWLENQKNKFGVKMFNLSSKKKSLIWGLAGFLAVSMGPYAQAQGGPDEMQMQQAQAVDWNQCARILVQLKTWFRQEAAPPAGTRRVPPRATNEDCLTSMLPSSDTQSLRAMAALRAASTQLQPLEPSELATPQQVLDAHRTLSTVYGSQSIANDEPVGMCRHKSQLDGSWTFELVGVPTAADFLQRHVVQALQEYRSQQCGGIVSRETRATGSVARRRVRAAPGAAARD